MDSTPENSTARQASETASRLLTRKADTRFEAFKSFIERGAPAFLSFGLAAAVLSPLFMVAASIVTGGGVALGAMNLLGGMAAGGLMVGSGAAAVSGGLAAYRTVQETRNVNGIIEAKAEELQQAAGELSQGVSQQLEQTVGSALSPGGEEENPAKNNPAVQNIIERGPKALSPEEILKDTAKDAQYAIDSLQR